MTVPPPHGTQPGWPPPPPRFDVGDAFSWAWAKFRANTTTLVLAALVLLAMGAVIYVLALLAAASWTDGGFFLEVDEQSGSIKGLGEYFAFLGVFYLVVFIASIPAYALTAGFIGLCLRIADGESPGIGSMFALKNPFRVMLTGLMISLITVVGLALCYLPGLAFAVFATFTIYFVVDRDQRPVEALRSSVTVAKNNFGNVLVVVLLSGMVAAGGVFLCVVGVLITMPLALLVHVYTYRFLTGAALAP